MKFVLIQVDLFLLHTYIQNVVQPRYCEIMLAKIGHWNSSGRAKMMVVVYDISSKMFCTMASVVEKAPREPSATSCRPCELGISAIDTLVINDLHLGQYSSQTDRRPIIQCD